MPSYQLEGVIPVVDPNSFVHPTASLVGDVVIGPRCYIGPGASLRGDFGRIIIEAGCNVQDNCILHSFPGEVALLEEEAHVGHGAVLHGCTVGRGSLIGIHSVLMDGVIVEEEAIVGAMSFVPAAFVVPRRTLVFGSPARVVRPLQDEEMQWKAKGTRQYQELAQRCLASFRECAPLPAPEPDRPRIAPIDAVPLHTIERGRAP
jgi:phenylacetic acid degradation protein